MNRKPTIAAVALALLTALSACSEQINQINQITSVSPSSAEQGTVGLTVTFALDTDNPSAPAAGILPASVMIGGLSGTSIVHSSRYSVTAVFTIPTNETVGLKAISVVFSSPAATFTNSAGFTVTVGSGVAAGFTGSPTSGAPPLTVTFTNTSTGSITNQLWSFGDSATSTDLHPTHTYTDIGSYAVSLTVFGTGGSNTLIRAGYITVAEPPGDGTYVVVDTGQTKCYNNTAEITAPAAGQAFYGQDAQCVGNPPSYTASADGLTVYDNNTGLTWTQSPDLDGVINFSDKLTFTNFLTYAATLNATNYCGYSDWRAPTIKELYSLIDLRGGDPSSYSGIDTSVLTPFIDTDYFAFGYGDTSVGERIIDAQYWSSTEYVYTTMNGDATVFGYNFADGRIKGYPRDINPTLGGAMTEYARFVRGNTSYGINQFADNGDGTVTDSATGLMWAQSDSGSGLNWSNALAWVQTQNAANYLGHSDWRLPNTKELQSIVDYTRSPDTTGSAAINAIFSCTQITNEEGVADYPFYWTGTTLASWNGSGSAAAYIAFGRALGYMNSAWLDVHGAGAQRSDPKDGVPNPYGFGPQGDVVRIFNYVRLVRDI